MFVEEGGTLGQGAYVCFGGGGGGGVEGGLLIHKEFLVSLFALSA